MKNLDIKEEKIETKGTMKVTQKRNNCVIIAEEKKLSKIESITFNNDKVQINYKNGEAKELEKGQDIMMRLF